MKRPTKALSKAASLMSREGIKTLSAGRFKRRQALNSRAYWARLSPAERAEWGAWINAQRVARRREREQSTRDTPPDTAQ